MHAWRIKVRAKQKAPWTSRLLQQIELRAANDDEQEQGRNCDGGYAGRSYADRLYMFCASCRCNYVPRAAYLYTRASGQNVVPELG